MKTHIRIPSTTVARCGQRITSETKAVDEYYNALESDCKNCQKASARYKNLISLKKYFAEHGEEFPKKGSPITDRKEAA